MYLKITQSGSRQYLQLVESYRDEKGRARQRGIVTLGRMDKIGNSLDAVHAGLSRILGISPVTDSEDLRPVFGRPRSVGDLWVLNEIWQQLGLNRLGSVLRKSARHKTEPENVLRIKVFNRLCNAHADPGVLGWLRTVSMPGVKMKTVSTRQLVRTMDAMVRHKDALNEVLADVVRPLVNEELPVVFCCLTAIRTEEGGVLAPDVRKQGSSEENITAGRFLLGLAQTAEGIPLYHEVFEADTPARTALRAALEKVHALFPARRIIAVADRETFSADDAGQLRSMPLPNGRPLEFILALPEARYTEFAGLLSPVNQSLQPDSSEEAVHELAWQNLRLVISHDPLQAQEQSRDRDVKIAELERLGQQWMTKSEDRKAGTGKRGRGLSESGERLRFYRTVADARLGHIVRVDLKKEAPAYQIDKGALEDDRSIDGKLLLLSNASGLSAKEVVKRYRSLRDVERSFRVFRSDIDVGPVYRRLSDRIRTHAAVCFIALLLQRVMGLRLRERPVSGIESPERALAYLREIHTGSVRLHGLAKPVKGLSAIDNVHSAIFGSMRVRHPTNGDAFVNLV